jgi:uncharacterized integral membrane protein
MRYVYLALIVLLTALVLVFTVQNLGTVSVAFLTARITLPVSILVILVYLLGMVTGGALVSAVRGWIQRARARP